MPQRTPSDLANPFFALLSWIKDYAVALSLGLVSFFLVLGWRILIPTNVAWLAKNDPATFYLGWGFFRQTKWMWPPGANPNYGLDLGSSIFYSDSIPLVAIVAKLFSAWLPTPFQYWGIWLLLCFMLQAFFGWKLAELLTSRFWPKFFSSCLFVFAPPFLFRLNFHYSLCAQWLILASLYLCLQRSSYPRWYWWIVIGTLAAGIHSYIFAMVFFLWIADMIRRLFFDKAPLVNLGFEAVFFVGISIVVLWISGFFLVQKGLDSWGLGDAHMNLLSLINSKNSPIGGKWSYVLPRGPSDSFDFEGFNYMGLGIIFLSGFWLYSTLSYRHFEKWDWQWFPLICILSFLTIFALSNRIAFGHYILLTYSVPHIFEALRSSGRMFWPVFYAGLFFLIRGLLKTHGYRTSLWVLGFATVIQILDTSAGWLIVRHNRNDSYGSTWNSPLQSEFWDKASSHYKYIYLVPSSIDAPKYYQTFAYYALQHGMGTDGAYLARIDPFKVASHNHKILMELSTGDFEPQTLYILDPDNAALAKNHIHPDSDLLDTIDGFTVLAPGWKTNR